MSADIDITFESGPVKHLPIPATNVDFPITNAFRKLHGWSLRDASGELPTQAEGSATAPAAGATIMTSPALVAGTYDITWNVSLQGAAAAAEVDNFQLFAGATAIQVSVNPGAAGNYPQGTVRVTVTTGTTIIVKAVGAGTAAIVYSASAQIIPDSPVGFVVEFQDGGDPCGEAAAQYNQTANQWFGDDGIYLASLLKLHVIGGTVTGTVYVGDIDG